MRITAILPILSAIAMIAFTCLFVLRNAAGMAQVEVTAVIAVIYSAVFSYACVLLAHGLWRNAGPLSDRPTAMVSRLVLAIGTALLCFVFVDATITDYYQPLSLFDDVIAALAVSWGALCIALAVLLVNATGVSVSTLRRAALLTLIATLGWPLMAAMAPLNATQPNSALDLHRDVFTGGEDGYDVYRIPGLAVLPAGSALANGETLSRERLLAFAEARRDGALDTGSIDLVLKHSDDGGDSWSEQRLVCRYRQGDTEGKCGNATPVFDMISGSVHLAYNLSGIPSPDTPAQASKRLHTAMLSSSMDGGQSWDAARQVADGNLVFGPGHGIQKRLAPHKGRLLLPGYRDEHPVAIYSDDNGATWQQGEPLDTGNETELAELPDGRIYLATRHRAPIGRPPQPNGRLFSTSSDGGHSWTATTLDPSLPTPVCQASVASYPLQQGLLFANPAHHKARVRMTVRLSPDSGEHWPKELLVYPGPAGYSQLGVSDSGNVYLLYERGAVSYSERISFARIAARQLAP